MPSAASIPVSSGTPHPGDQVPSPAPLSVWFGGGRIGVHVQHPGTISELVYYGAQPMERACFFSTGQHSPYQKLFCPYLLVDGRAWRLEPGDARFYPAGWVCRQSIPAEGLELRHSLVVFDDAVVHRVEVLANRDARPLRLRLSLHDYLRRQAEGRTWSAWDGQAIPGALTAQVADPARAPGGATATTWLGVVGSAPLATRAFSSGRRFFDSAELPPEGGTVAVLFAGSAAGFAARAAELAAHGPGLAAAQVAGWDERLRAAPAIALGQPAVESFFRHSGLICDMLSPADLPGAMRAAVGHYWVWGWDTLVHSDSYLVNGRAAFVRAALALYRRTAHPELGIGHQFDETMAVRIPQALPAQGLYAIMLQQYLAWSGDDGALAEFFPFARTIFQRTCAQARRHGLYTGIALFPDYPRFAGQSGGEGDLSVFNNGIFCQAARAMEHLAGQAGDVATARQAREAWLACEQAFRARLWDGRRGYWYDSLASADASPRPSYPAHAILWVQSTARDLVAGREQACAAFFAEHLVCVGGIRPYPLWDPAFNGDGNQFGQYYPAGVDMAFLRLMAATGRQDQLGRWLGWVACFWGQHTVPEGVTLEAENDGPHLPDCPGGKQPFTVKPWHMGLVNAIAGIEFDHGGITCGPGLDRPLTLAGIRHRGRTVALATAGAGVHVAAIAVNGRPLAGSCKIPADHCPDPDWRIELHRAAVPPAGPAILAADGATLTRLRATGTSLAVQIDAPGSVRVWLRAAAAARITWQGAAIAGEREADGRCAVLLLADGGPVGGELTVDAPA
ncbi:MAG: hypothetical protein L6R48_07890 [Planctomycetes bacterium]|nr:hypothetical protein [Planctomycetota bacterium]